MANRTISLSVDTVDDAAVPRVMEVLARHAAGLVLEGVDVRLYLWTDTEEYDSD